MKSSSTRGLGSPNGNSSFSFGATTLGSRIAKPLRGGGGGVDEGVERGVGGGNKRSSWFFSGGQK